MVASEITKGTPTLGVDGTLCAGNNLRNNWIMEALFGAIIGLLLGSLLLAGVARRFSALVANVFRGACDIVSEADLQGTTSKKKS